MGFKADWMEVVVTVAVCPDGTVTFTMIGYATAPLVTQAMMVTIEAIAPMTAKTLLTQFLAPI